MVSFDVVSLFTSIPQDLAIAVLRDRLDQSDNKQQQDSLQTEDLIRLVGICLKTYFTFQGTIFEQIKGTPMGSPISSVIAELVLQQLEHIVMAQYQPKFWARYVDDTFVIIKKQHKTDFMGILNSVYPDIQFTMEEECQCSLAFLDVLIQRQRNGTLDTRVYRKSTCTDRILHYGSNHPAAHKASCIRTLFRRVESHCSTARAKKEETSYLFRICKRNGYPTRFIKRHSIPSGSRGNPLIEEPTPLTTHVTLPYICNVSEATARLLAPFNVKVAHKPNQTLRAAIMRPKDPLPNMEKSAVVYRLDCMDCPSNYVGETSKRVKTRVHEHRLAVKRGEQRSQVWTHMAESGHHFNFNEVHVLASDNTKGGRLLKEAWLSNGDSINRHIDLCPAHLALRSWSEGGRSSRYRQLGNMPDMLTNETKKEKLTPQRTRGKAVEREQQLKTITTPMTRTRLQRIREAAKSRTQDPSIKNTQGATFKTLGDTTCEVKKRGQHDITTSCLHPKGMGMTDPGTSRWPSDSKAPIQQESPAQLELGTNNNLEGDKAQRGKMEEELKNEPRWENISKDRIHSNPINISPHPTAPLPIDLNELKNSCTRVRNNGERGGVRKDRGVVQDDRDSPPPDLSEHRKWIRCANNDGREIGAGREEDYEMNEDLAARTSHLAMLIEKEDLGGSNTQKERTDEELKEEPRREDPHERRICSALMNTHPHPVTPALTDTGDPRDNWVLMRRTRGRREVGSEHGGVQRDRNPPTPDLGECGIQKKSPPDEDGRETEIAGSGDLATRATYSATLTRGGRGKIGRMRIDEWGKEHGEGGARIEQGNDCRAHPSDKSNVKSTHLVMAAQLNQSTTWDHPRSNEQTKTPNERDDPHRNRDHKKDWGERRGGEYRPFELFTQESEEGNKNKQRDEKGVTPNLKVDGGETEKVTHTNAKQEPFTGMQVIQLGPMTRSRSRAQKNLANE